MTCRVQLKIGPFPHYYEGLCRSSTVLKVCSPTLNAPGLEQKHLDIRKHGLGSQDQPAGCCFARWSMVPPRWLGTCTSTCYTMKIFPPDILVAERTQRLVLLHRDSRRSRHLLRHGIHHRRQWYAQPVCAHDTNLLTSVASITSNSGGTCVCPPDHMDNLCDTYEPYALCVQEINRDLVTATAAISALTSFCMGQ